MDLYKHAFRLSPLVSSDLVADCFELDLDPIRIETAAGKQEYAAAQRAFADRAAPIRDRLISECDRLIAAPN